MERNVTERNVILL